MKKIYSFIIALAAFASVSCVTSCSSDADFTESIFDTQTLPYDLKSATGPFDKWLYENFVTPYNTEIQYKFNMNASDMSYQLAPADYKKSQLLSHFIKYLFYDVYNKYGGDDFMKKYGPRIFHYIGSVSYSPTTNTETQGYASSGVKITLINVNDMKTVSPGMEYTGADVDMLNKDQFHVMHHEFSHILHQTKTYPVNFGQVTPGSYDPRTWQERDSTYSHQLGYITQYGSSANTEDFVETLSCIITDTDYRWMTCIIDACLNGGVKAGDKELIYDLIDSLEIANFDDPDQYWNNFTVYLEEAMDEDTKEWKSTDRCVIDAHIPDARNNAKQNLRYRNWVYLATSFRDFLDNWVELDQSSETKGINAILKKIDIARKWYKENYGLNLFEIRREVRERQNSINDFIKTVEIYDYQ